MSYVMLVDMQLETDFRMSENETQREMRRRERFEYDLRVTKDHLEQKEAETKALRAQLDIFLIDSSKLEGNQKEQKVPVVGFVVI